MFQKSWSSIAGRFWLQFSHQVAVKLLSRVQASPVLTRAENALPNSVVWLLAVLANHWPETAIPCHVGFSYCACIWAYVCLCGIYLTIDKYLSIAEQHRIFFLKSSPYSVFVISPLLLPPFKNNRHKSPFNVKYYFSSYS